MKALIAITAAAGALFAQNALAADPAKLAQAKGCMACHQVDKQIIGPSYNDVAARYKDQADAVDVLMASVKTGSTGKWTSSDLTALNALY